MGVMAHDHVLQDAHLVEETNALVGARNAGPRNLVCAAALDLRPLPDDGAGARGSIP